MRTSPSQGAAGAGGALVALGVAQAPMPGQHESGDLYFLHASTAGVLLAGMDGAGHGTEAAAAARIAVATLEEFAHESVTALLLRCHRELKGTRGVAMTLAFIRHRDRALTWLGVGNVEGVLFRQTDAGYVASDRALLLGGLVGHQLPPLRASVLPVSPNDVVILATDGIRPDFADQLTLDRDVQQVADRILVGHHKGTDDALVVVARYLGAQPP